MAIVIQVEAYAHPGSHDPSIITQDANNRFVTDAQIAAWDAVVGDSQPAADQAAASAAAALASEQAAAASEAQTAADVIATAADVIATAADRVQTGLDATTASDAAIAASASEVNADASEVAAAASEAQCLVYKDQAEAAAAAAGAASFTTGDVKIALKVVADAGWVMADDGTIGSAASGASNRANADTEDLYKLIWDNIPNTYAPVTGGRGASAQADFDADKPIQIGTFLGRALAVAGAGTGLTARVLGEVLGAETHQLTDAEMPSHNHNLSDPGHVHTQVGALGEFIIGTESGAAASGSANTGSSTTGITLDTEGSDQAHNNMQPTSFVNIFIKL